MMELGATICTPRHPRCDLCPVSVHCRGRERPEYWSEGKPRRAGIRTAVDMALVLRGGRIMLTRNPAGILLGGLYELPHSGLPRGSELPVSLGARYRGVLRIEDKAAATVRHAVTHHRIEASIYRARLIGRRLGSEASLHTIDQARALPLGGLTRKALRALGLIAD
jgi:A/G-specific adenine glycosylase